MAQKISDVSLRSSRFRKLMTLLVVALLCAAPGTGRSQETNELPKHIEYSRQISAAIKAEATAKTDADRIEAVRKMARLYTDLKRDPRLPESEKLREYKARLWGRLTFVKKRWEREISRLERELGAKPTANNVDQEAIVSAKSISDGLDLVAATMGGPAAILASGVETQAHHDALGGAARLDFGRELVDLIESTIAPDFWDVNGGPGTIVYYAPLHALVVRATGEVHDEIGGVISDLR